MPKRNRNPNLAPARQITDPLAALGEPHRLVVFGVILRHNGRVAYKALFETLQKEFGLRTKVELTRILDRFEEAKLVARTMNLDRSVTVTANTETLDRVCRYLNTCYLKLVPPAPTAGGAAVPAKPAGAGPS